MGSQLLTGSSRTFTLPKTKRFLISRISRILREIIRHYGDLLEKPNSASIWFVNKKKNIAF